MRRLVFVLAFALAVSARTFAAGVLPEDFSVRGVALGSVADDAALAAAFGEPLFDNDRSVFGIRVKYFSFKKRITVGVFDGRIVDIRIENEDYVGRDGVRYGATPHKIDSGYGRTERRMIAGVIYYIYENPANRGERLMLAMDGETNFLASWRVTSLPLTESEADDGEDWANSELNAFLMRERDIDMSALEKKK